MENFKSNIEYDFCKYFSFLFIEVLFYNLRREC